MSSTGDPQTSFSDVLLSIKRTATEIMNISGSVHDSKTTLLPLVDLQIIPLPEPPPIDVQLVALGLDQKVVIELSQLYFRKAAELKQRTEEAVAEVCRKPRTAALMDEFQVKLHAVHEKLYMRRLEEWRKETINVAQTIRSRLHSDPQSDTKFHTRHKQRPFFNHDYVPLLEHYFAENPLPTHADKNFLAKKCGMTFRQIHVWFQNRRNRTRKEGQVFKRKPQHEPGKLPLDTLIAKMPHSIIPKDQRVKYVDSDSSEYEWQYESSEDDVSGWVERHPRDSNPIDVFDIPTPPYAFPAVYSPEIEHEPFPRDRKASFPPPQWDRRPAKAPSKRPPVMDFDGFSDEFSQMSVKERPRKRWRVKKSSDPQKRAKAKRTSPPHPKPDRSAATIFITTKPLAAPLAAFIRPTTASRRFLVPPLPTVSAPPSRKRVFESLNPTSTPATLVATPLLSAEELPSPKAKSSSRRKIAPLPRRVPNDTSVAYRAITPATSNISVSSEQDSPSPSSSSRSLSSESSSKRIRLSSDDSCSASEVTTPEPSSLSLSTDIPPPLLSIAGFDFNSPSTMNDLFCESPADPSSADRLQLAFPSGNAYGANEGNKDLLFGFEFDQSLLHIQS